MKRDFCRYYVYIPCTGPLRPVRIRDSSFEQKFEQQCNLVGGLFDTVSIPKAEKCVLIVSKRAQTSTAENLLNEKASRLFSRGAVVKGDALLCMLRDEDGCYLGFEKPIAQGICLWANISE